MRRLIRLIRRLSSRRDPLGCTVCGAPVTGLEELCEEHGADYD